MSKNNLIVFYILSLPVKRFKSFEDSSCTQWHLLILCPMMRLSGIFNSCRLATGALGLALFNSSVKSASVGEGGGENTYRLQRAGCNQDFLQVELLVTVNSGNAEWDKSSAIDYCKCQSISTATALSFYQTLLNMQNQLLLRLFSQVLK